MCVCLILKKFQDLASPTPMDYHFLPIFRVAELWDGRLVAFPLAYHGCFSRWASALKLGDGKGS